MAGNGTTGKVEPSALLLEEERFSFQRAISRTVHDNDIPQKLVINLDQTSLTYVSTEKYTFHVKGAPHVPIKGLMTNDK